MRIARKEFGEAGAVVVQVAAGGWLGARVEPRGFREERIAHEPRDHGIDAREGAPQVSVHRAPVGLEARVCGRVVEERGEEIALDARKRTHAAASAGRRSAIALALAASASNTSSAGMWVSHSMSVGLGPKRATAWA